jgi:hypothetical protein
MYTNKKMQWMDVAKKKSFPGLVDSIVQPPATLLA